MDMARLASMDGVTLDLGHLWCQARKSIHLAGVTA